MVRASLRSSSDDQALLEGSVMTQEYTIVVGADRDGTTTVTLNGLIVADPAALFERMYKVGAPVMVHCPSPPSDVFLAPSAAASVDCGTNLVHPLSDMEWPPKSANEP